MMLNKKPLTCIFLGSGASLNLAGIKIGNEFIKEVLADGRESWINYETLKIGGSELSEWIEKVGDIELCMSHLYNLASKNREFASVAIINLRAAIAEYLKKFLSDTEADTLSSKEKELKEKELEARDLFKQFLQEVRKRSNIVILTTNYDLFIERLFNEMKLPWYYPKISQQTAGSHAEGIPIYKFHGSINWLEERWLEGEDIKSKNPPALTVKDPENLIDNGILRLFSIKEENGKRHRGYSPVLIPFFFQKEEWLGGRWREIFEPHWESAAECLTKDVSALNFYFFGYKLPQADHNMLTWLLEILNNAKIQKVLQEIIAVCKPNPNCLDNSDKEMLQKALDPFIKPENVHQEGLAVFLKKYFGKRNGNEGSLPGTAKT
ncbi:MAG: SIR2 family protein [Candidatus Manganitrophus sp.]|nr:MAG: SIR2 family protein [Candidatus Manganitrophus sp.]